MRLFLAIANMVDPNAPRAEGAIISPARGEQLVINDAQPRSLDAALLKFGTGPTAKQPVAVVLDQTGRPSSTLIYSSSLLYTILNLCMSI